MSKLKPGDRVKLDNPGGYDGYRGTLVRERTEWAVDDEWWDIKWDMPFPPCTTPMQSKHLLI